MDHVMSHNPQLIELVGGPQDGDVLHVLGCVVGQMLHVPHLVGNATPFGGFLHTTKARTVNYQVIAIDGTTHKGKAEYRP